MQTPYGSASSLLPKFPPCDDMCQAVLRRVKRSRPCSTRLPPQSADEHRAYFLILTEHFCLSFPCTYPKKMPRYKRWRGRRYCNAQRGPIRKEEGAIRRRVSEDRDETRKKCLYDEVWFSVRTRRAWYESTCTTNGLQQIGGGGGSRTMVSWRPRTANRDESPDNIHGSTQRIPFHPTCRDQEQKKLTRSPRRRDGCRRA